MLVRVSLLQASCLDGVVNIRGDGDALMTNGGGNNGLGPLIARFGFFDRSSGFEFNTSGSGAAFELVAENKSCRLNMEIEVTARGGNEILHMNGCMKEQLLPVTVIGLILNLSSWTFSTLYLS